MAMVALASNTCNLPSHAGGLPGDPEGLARSYRHIECTRALLHRTGYRSAARTVFAQAVATHPDLPAGRVNLGNVLRQDGALAAARSGRAGPAVQPAGSADHGLPLPPGRLPIPAIAPAHPSAPDGLAAPRPVSSWRLLSGRRMDAVCEQNVADPSSQFYLRGAANALNVIHAVQHFRELQHRPDPLAQDPAPTRRQAGARLPQTWIHRY